MTDKEAIKYLELHSAFNGKLDKGNCIRITEENFTKTKLAIETVLNLIQTQQEEIFKLQAKADRLKVARENWKKTYNQAEEEIEKYKYLYPKALNNTIKADRDNLKKDKIIDEMAFSLADYIMYYDYDKCRNPGMIKDKADQEKEYFINKVEKENKEYK